MSIQRSSRLSLEVTGSFLDAWADRFASQQSFQTIDGRPVMSILNIADFTAVYGLDGFRILLGFMRRRIVDRLGVDPFLIGLFGILNTYNVRFANSLPLDGTTGYGLLPDWDGPPIQRYDQLIEKRVREWHRCQQALAVPFFPVVCAGWDATVRGERVKDLRATRGFPWRPVVVGVTPELFGAFLDHAIRFNDDHHPDRRIVFVHAWNEWTEGSAVEPSDRYGTSFLDEIRSRADRLTASGPGPCDPGAGLPQP